MCRAFALPHPLLLSTNILIGRGLETSNLIGGGDESRSVIGSGLRPGKERSRILKCTGRSSATVGKLTIINYDNFEGIGNSSTL